jgi:ATP-binding protein involved in chromosome partitioning
MSLTDAVMAALATVNDPEIHRPLTELDMIKNLTVGADGGVHVEVWLTVSGCPMRDTITERVTNAVGQVAGVRTVDVTLDVMSDEQRQTLRSKLGGPTRENQFNRAGSLTRIYAIASGKGGVGKSSITSNLAVALSAAGKQVGIVDADIYGHSIPRQIGATGLPTMVEGMIMPPQAHGVRVISLLPFKAGGVFEPAPFRGPKLHKFLEQFITDVWWGDLDVLLLDLPPGTGDIAMSVAQLLPTAEVIVVTTPQLAAAEVAVRAGMMSTYTKQRITGVIENMSSVPCPHCGEPMDLFGIGGGAMVSETLSQELGYEIPLLARIPFDVRLREGGDRGEPLILADPSAPASAALQTVVDKIAARPLGLAGRPLGLSPAGR